ncbi:hypothetical protein C3L33_07256, partial [Rhododendron williamsianum]
MHAVQYDHYGGGAAGLKHVEVPVRAPKKDDVLIKVEAASLNPFDWKMQKGVMHPILPFKFPYIPAQLSHLDFRAGYDLSGNLMNLMTLSHIDELEELEHTFGTDCFLLMVGTVGDIAGEVVEVGFQVKKFKPGDKVVAFLSPFSGGGLAEFAVAKENLTVPRPPEVSAAEAAGLPIAGLTAHQALTQSAGVKLDGSGPRKNL